MLDLDSLDKEYPLGLSMGRQVHTSTPRTKTGRSKELQAAAPAPFIELSEEDATNANVEDGEDIVPRSRRVMVEHPVKITPIAKRQTFIPFRFGYFEGQHGCSASSREEIAADGAKYLRVRGLPSLSGQLCGCHLGERASRPASSLFRR